MWERKFPHRDREPPCVRLLLEFSRWTQLVVSQSLWYWNKSTCVVVVVVVLNKRVVARTFLFFFISFSLRFLSDGYRGQPLRLKNPNETVHFDSISIFLYHFLSFWWTCDRHSFPMRRNKNALSALPVKWRNFFQLPSHFPENINIPIIGESLHRLSLAFYFSIPRISLWPRTSANLSQTTRVYTTTRNVLRDWQGTGANHFKWWTI